MSRTRITGALPVFDREIRILKWRGERAMLDDRKSVIIGNDYLRSASLFFPAFPLDELPSQCNRPDNDLGRADRRIKTQSRGCPANFVFLAHLGRRVRPCLFRLPTFGGRGRRMRALVKRLRLADCGLTN